MGYLFLAAALAMGVTKGSCGKKTSGLVKETADALRMNTLRMLFCILFGFFSYPFVKHGGADTHIICKPLRA